MVRTQLGLSMATATEPLAGTGSKSLSTDRTFPSSYTKSQPVVPNGPAQSGSGTFPRQSCPHSQIKQNQAPAETILPMQTGFGWDPRGHS